MVQNQTSFKVAEVEVSYKSNYNITERPQINSSQVAYKILLQHWQLGKIELLEEFKVILLNTSNRVLGIVDISVGGVSGTLADPKIIFAVALKTNSSKIILSHNHPSGNLNPSEADKRLTQKLKDGGKLLDIEVCDHIIVTNHSYFSFADECIM
ncbi:JAB domain-containing protein [Pedobacter agri]|uniref:JAB domain-containing protein n=1 Tax=Pedobacter agri TaxID=454586 RepID=UPI0029309ABC|nr:JAB domain-containing protein [Pedobacter agri]